MILKIVTYAGIGIIKLFSLIPLSLLYKISDLMFPLVYHVFRYRRYVVAENLSESFPGKNPKELIEIERTYYHYLCDLIVETIKTRTLSLSEISKRMTIRNPDLINGFFREGKSVIVMTLHYGNWEWLIHVANYLEHHSLIIYKPLQNQIFDRFMNKTRERFGGKAVSMSLALRKLIAAEKNKMPVLTWLAADQTPPWNHPYWTMFLHQKTQFFNGPAKLAQRFNQPVFFQQVKRIRRGYYETWFTLLFENPREVTEETITLAYVREAEKVIEETPENYLWSHRRWKNKKHAPEKIFANLPV